MEDWIKILAGVVTASVGGALGWLWRRVFNLENSHAAHKDHVSETYLRREDAHREFGRIESRIDAMQSDQKGSFESLEKKLDKHFQRIYDKLDTKADK